MTDATSNAGHEEVDHIALAPGATIGRYEVVSILGQGGFGITYRARDAELGREVAIKEYLPGALAIRQDGATVLPRSTKMAEDFAWGRDRFVAEGRTLASLQRAPAIVRVFDFLQANGTAYIVMELLSGETLEGRISRKGRLEPEEIEKILWPLLDGLQQVHDAGFLHRDIKPANILLDGNDNPTLIDFGASRAAVAGRTTAMTAIFTPGYAAAEQFTSAKQGPWTDIYGLAATIYHAIAGKAPPSAFDRMLDDGYEPLASLAPPGFSPGLVIGIDAGLAVRANERPQSIAGWRSILGQSSAPAAQATVLLARGPDTVQAKPAASSPPPPAAPTAVPKRGMALWAGIAAAVLVVGGGGYYLATKPPAVDPALEAAAEKAREELAAAEAARRKAEADAARLRAENEAREKAEREAAQRRQIEQETRRKVEAELAEKRRLEEEARRKIEAEQAEARQKAEAEEAARRRAEEEDKRSAEAAENVLRLTVVDRQRVQVALTALGFNTGGTDGAFGPRTREMLAAWQKARDHAATGFLTAPQNEALLRETASAIARFDEEQKRLEEEKKKAAAPPPAPTAAAPASSDGTWNGTYICHPPPGVGGEPIRINFTITLRGGKGKWAPPMTRGTISIAIDITGEDVRITRVIVPTPGPHPPRPTAEAVRGGTLTVGLVAKLSGNTISGQGQEAPSPRRCSIHLTRKT